MLRRWFTALLLCVGVAPFLCSCNSLPPVAVPPSNAGLELSSVARSVEQSIRILAAAKKVDSPVAINTAPLTTAAGGMGGTARIDWSGPIEPLLEKVAKMSGYHVKVLGPTPAIPIIISMTASKAVIADIVKDAGLQAGKRANVVVFPIARTIELRYATV